MRRYFCDRCGGPIEDGRMYWLQNKIVTRRILSFSKNQLERAKETNHEICEACQKEFWDWWKAKSPEGKDQHGEGTNL